jgi:hypothetical protein
VTIEGDEANENVRSQHSHALQRLVHERAGNSTGQHFE